MEHIRKGLIHLEYVVIQPKFSTRRCRHHIDLAAFEKGMIGRAEYLSNFVIRRTHHSADQSNYRRKDKPWVPSTSACLLDPINDLLRE